LRLSGCKIGLLINFHVEVLKDGVKRIVLDYTEPRTAEAQRAQRRAQRKA
jgi:hypothetical protein